MRIGVPASAHAGGVQFRQELPRRELSKASAGDLHVSVLGAFQLEEAHAPVAMPMGGQRLLAFLALAGIAMKRPLVAGTLWPDASENHAYGNLRSALARLGASGRRAVRADNGDVELAPTVQVDVQDARALALRLLAPAPPSQSDLGPGARVILSADLLPGWYDDWVLVEAEEWHQLSLHALEALADHLIRAGRFGEAASAAAASIRAEPMRESAHASLIRVHLAEGNESEARRQLARLRQLLRVELGLEPSVLITELFGEQEEAT